MKRQHQDFNQFKKKALKDPKIKAEYDKLQSEFIMVEKIIKNKFK